MLFAGIDWSEKFLDFHLRTAEGKVLAEGQVKPSVEGMADLFARLESHALASEIGIAIETAHGAWAVTPGTMVLLALGGIGMLIKRRGVER